MDYDKVYFPKTEMSQLVPTGYFSPETYAAYAESFDLSLLPTDCEPQFDFNQCQTEFMSLDYMPTATIFNDNQQQQSILMTIKTEKSWPSDKDDLNQSITNTDTDIITSTVPTTTTTTTDSSILLQQLQKQYQFYPSPLPSPPQYDFNHQITSVNNNCSSILTTTITSQLPPSPTPSIEQSITTTPIQQNFNAIEIKKEYLILPPSPPESNGAPSPFSEIKSEPGDIDTENFIDINSLLEKSLIQFDTTTTKTAPTTPLTTKRHISESLNQIKKSTTTIGTSVGSSGGGGVGIIVPQDHQVLREYLQDTTFQKKHNLKPLALESLIGGFSVRGDIEPVISLALEHAKRDAQATCANLQISLDPQQWTTTQVHAWIRSTIAQFKLSQIDNLESKFPENGANLLCLTEDEFVRRVPESGGTIHAQLEIWKLACCDNFLTDLASPAPSTSNWVSDCPQNMDISDDEDDDLPSSIIKSSDDPTITTNGNTINTQSSSTTSATITTIPNSGISPTSSTSSTTQANSTTSSSSTTATTATTTTTAKPPRTGGSHIHLWQFLKELLATPQLHGTAIRWLDRNKGVFKIEDSVRVAKLWGRRKNRPAMNYDKLSRSIRQYYKKGIMKKTERSQRLVYQFCHPYCL